MDIFQEALIKKAILLKERLEEIHAIRNELSSITKELAEPFVTYINNLPQEDAERELENMLTSSGGHITRFYNQLIERIAELENDY